MTMELKMKPSAVVAVAQRVPTHGWDQPLTALVWVWLWWRVEQTVMGSLQVRWVG